MSALLDLTDAVRNVSLPTGQRSSGALARRYCEVWLATWGLAELTDPVDLIVSEFIQNVVKHTDSPVAEVLLALYPHLHVLLIQVADAGKPLVEDTGDWLREADDDEEGGRGLKLVELLSAASWHVANPDVGQTRCAVLDLAA